MTDGPTTSPPSILLIDDDETLLEALQAELADVIGNGSPEIRTWLPTAQEPSAEEAFQAKIDDGTVLVVTDYDLTSRGERGLFGPSIVEWCQNKTIPVGDYSRKHGGLPSEPNLFEVRVPTDTGQAAPFIAATYRGFKRIHDELVAKPNLMTERSPALVLANLLSHPSAQGEFSLYISWLSSANSGLIEKLRLAAPPNSSPSPADKVSLLSYVAGHVLLNAILKYPGPILSDEALCAYTAVNSDEIATVAPLFETARYTGPFSDMRRYFWREAADSILDELATGIAGQEFETFGELNRCAIENRLKTTLRRHACTRCNGQNGGFYCPFTRRSVCPRSDCSVGASSWIPQGAQLCRIERDFYEEWAPLLGL